MIDVNAAGGSPPVATLENWFQGIHDGKVLKCTFEPEELMDRLEDSNFESDWQGPIIAAMPVDNEEETIGSVILACLPHVE